MKKFKLTQPINNSQISEALDSVTLNEGLRFEFQEMTKEEHSALIDQYVSTSSQGDGYLTRQNREPWKTEPVKVGHDYKQVKPVYFPEEMFQLIEVKYKDNSDTEQLGYITDFTVWMNVANTGVNRPPTVNVYALTKEKERLNIPISTASITGSNHLIGKPARKVLEDLKLVPWN